MHTADMEENTTSETKKPSNFWIDFGPLLVFFVAFQYLRRKSPDEAMLQAAGIFAVVAVIALLLGWLKHRYVSKMLIFSTVIIVVTAGLAIFSGNKTIFYMKPTIINALFGVAVLGGILLKKNVLKMMMGEAIILPDDKWNILALRWGLFFFAMAALNEFIWREMSEEFWVNFKVFGFLPLTFVFTLMQLPFIQKHGTLRGA